MAHIILLFLTKTIDEYVLKSDMNKKHLKHGILINFIKKSIVDNGDTIDTYLNYHKAGSELLYFGESVGFL